MGDNQYPPQPSPIREGRNAASPFTLHLSLKQRAAFTLAEVLITLGVIGVVAALTMPSLIANYQKKVLVTQIKKTYATLNEGFRQIMTSQGCTDMTCAGFLDSLTARGTLNEQQYLSYSDNFAVVSNTFKMVNTSTTFNQNSPLYDYDISVVGNEDETMSFATFLNDLLYARGYDNIVLSGALPDGSILFYQLGGLMLIDVNGKKKPNVCGRDIFLLWLMPDGRVIPCTDYNSWYYYNVYKNTLPSLEQGSISEVNRLYNLKDMCFSKWGDGAGACLELIIHDGWEMNY